MTQYLLVVSHMTSLDPPSWISLFFVPVNFCIFGNLSKRAKKHRSLASHMPINDAPYFRFQTYFSWLPIIFPSSLQELRWNLQIWWKKRRCTHHWTWEHACLWCVLWPNNSRRGVDSVPKETGRFGRFLPLLERLQTWLWRSQWRVLARKWQGPSPDFKWNQHPPCGFRRLRREYSLCRVQHVWCYEWEWQIQADSRILLRYEAVFSCCTIIANVLPKSELRTGNNFQETFVHRGQNPF